MTVLFCLKEKQLPNSIECKYFPLPYLFLFPTWFFSFFFLFFLLRLVFSVNTLTPSSDHPQQFSSFSVSFSLDVGKIFSFHSFFAIFFLVQIYSEVSKRCSVGVVSERGGGMFYFRRFFLFWIDHWKMCVHVSRGGGSWLFAASLESQANKDTEKRGRNKIQEGKKDVERNKNSEQIDGKV